MKTPSATSFADRARGVKHTRRDPALSCTPMAWRLERGANVDADGAVTFAVWAARRRTLAVRVLDAAGATRAELPMTRDADGVFTARADRAVAATGSDYVYVLPDVGARPDPVSRHQPNGVHAPSRIVSDRFAWTDARWRGVPREDLILYELHVGTFSPEGTFAGVAARLPYLRDLGITAVELMPVAACPGDRNWGYDGVYLFAPHAAYGGPEGLKRLADACHAHGLALVIDVVYNHLGPEGNYLGDYGPYFTDRYKTPWGDALNFDGPESDQVRRFFVDNALYWLTEYHADGLRLDAIQGIHDFSARPILQEIADAFHAEAARLGRDAWLIAESDLNDPRVIRPKDVGGLGLDAQWSDDFHHALHAVVTGNRRGYFGDFGRVADLSKAVTASFVYDGQHAPHRRRRHGASAVADAGDRFVSFIQNHDQVANAYQGKRLAQVVGHARQKVAAMLLFSAPSLPLLFHGEEYAEDAPFDYFTSHGDAALATAVREGRHAEYLHLLEEGADMATWSDPQADQTFLNCKLRWASLERAPHADMLAFYRALIAARRRLPPLRNGRKDLSRVESDEAGRWMTILRGDAGGGATLTCANLGDAPARIRFPEGRWRLALATDSAAAEGIGGETVAFAPSTAALYERVAD
jgi:maltooligosyltrehalose trehalohydrolase